MARIPVAELRVQTQGPGLVRVTANAPAVREGRDIRRWAQESGMSSGAMVTTGLALAALGGIGALVITPGLFGVVALSTMFTIGGGLAFLGLLKRRDRMDEPQPPALPSSPPAVVAERSRRVQALLEDGRDHTFEEILKALRWTEAALLETLVEMKEAGLLIEDLDLETGEWVYRSQVAAFGTGGGMTLADRQARIH